MKKLLMILLFFLLIGCSIFYPAEILEASKKGICIWFEQILPSLLPFSILSAVLLKSHLMDTFSKNANVTSIFITMFCGFIFGFPIGAKLSSDFYKNGLLTYKQAQILCVTTNNFSSMYICGYVLPLLFENHAYLTSTYLLLYLFPLFLAIILLFFKSDTKNIQKNTASRFQLDMQIIDAGIISSFETLIKICGYIVLFSLLSTIFKILFDTSNVFLQFLLCNLEITNGIFTLSESSIALHQKYIYAIHLLSFGGLSGFAQTASILKDTDLSIKKYLIGKLCISSIATLLALLCI